jgi:LPXTG-motif cell wall-anchored protein
MIEGGFSGRMHANGLAGSISWRFYPAIIFLIFGAAAGWLLIRKREKSNKNMS